MIMDPDETYDEREFVVCFSTIAYVEVRVKATSANRARSKADYKIKGRDQSGAWIPNGSKLIACPHCQDLGVTLSAQGLTLDYCEEAEVPDNEDHN